MMTGDGMRKTGRIRIRNVWALIWTTHRAKAAGTSSRNLDPSHTRAAEP
jgi:hypothetical protein